MDTRELLLETALERFSRLGYEGCGVQEICDAAGVTKPTLYHHYGSKRGLLDALIRRLTESLLEAIGMVLPYRSDLPATLDRLTGVFFNHAARFPREYRYYLSLLMAPASSESRDAVRSTDESIASLVNDLFRDAAGDHGNMAGRHQVLAAGYLGMVNTFGALVAEGRLEVTPDLVYRAVHQFSHGIYS